MTEYETVIGLEIHAELKTATKLFCGCRNDPFRAPEPNLYICPICLALPGTLPVMNRQAVEWSALVGLALGSQIGWPTEANSEWQIANRENEDPTRQSLLATRSTKWDRKNYFYPDLPKGYQISQYDLPICSQGSLLLQATSYKLQADRTIEITRIHLEEDTGKLVHPPSPKASEGQVPIGAPYSLIDYNRAGVPLLELVTEPVIRSGDEASAFASEYQLVLRTLGISNADMEKGEMRVEANVSVRRSQKSEVRSQKLGTKVEVKNLNSLKSVRAAIEYETERQIQVLARGEEVVQETRGWDEAKQRTFTQRVKETAADYRYFPEPDLPPVTIANGELQIANRENKNPHRQSLIAHRSLDLTKIKGLLPEMPWELRARYERDGVVAHDAERLVQNLELAKKYNELSGRLNESIGKKSLASWLVNGVFLTSEPDYHSPDIQKLLLMLIQGEITYQTAKTIRDQMIKTGQNFTEIYQAFTVDSKVTSAYLETVIVDILAKHSQAVADYRVGKTQALGFLVGQVMVATKSQADPQIVRERLLHYFKEASA